jgi:hypothetical protein
LMVFQVARRSVLTKLNWEAVDATRLALLQKVIREHSGTLLRAMKAARVADGPKRDVQGKRGGSRRRRH